MKYLLLALLALPTVSAAQTGSEIYLFGISLANGKITVTNPVNMTNHKGYDNQPFFHPGKSIVYYSSFNDSGRADIKAFNYSSNETSNITVTNEREYSPTVTPDGNFISCIIQRDNGAQDLGRYPTAGGAATVLINSLTVGYHTWLNEEELLLFVLGDSGRNSLHHYNINTKQDRVILQNPGRALHRIPNSNNFSFVHKVSKDEWVIKQFNSKSKEISVITNTIPGKEDIAWLTKDIIISSDGNILMYYDVKKKSGWQAVAMENGSLQIRGITRLAVNQKGNKLAVVAAE
jgi:Tol biopolymer transport system component